MKWKQKPSNNNTQFNYTSVSNATEVKLLTYYRISNFVKFKPFLYNISSQKIGNFTLHLDLASASPSWVESFDCENNF